MPADLYLRQTKAPLSRWKIAGLTLAIILVLLGLIWAGFYLTQKKNLDDYKRQFEQAISSQDYDRTMQIYRDTQAQAVSVSVPDQKENPYRNLLTEFEIQINSALESVDEKLLESRSLNEQDKELVEGFDEIAILHFSRLADQLALNELTGRTGGVPTEAILTALNEIESIKDESNMLLMQLPSIQSARPLVESADALQTQNLWLASFEAWTALAENNDLAPFVQEYSRQRAQTCKSAMYQPLLDEALQLVSQNRLYTAQKKLQALQPVFPEDPEIKAALENCQEQIPDKLEIYRSTVEHLTIKPLIVRPDLAFDGDIYAGAARDTMLTTQEFRRMLDALYENQYILIDQSRMIPADEKGFGLALPAGKKPLVLVLEGLNYYVSRRETGNCWNLVLDNEMNVCGEYFNQQNERVIDRQAEAIGILDQFVEEHPDFSYDGAKGLITLTGYEGVFGYVTDPDQLDDRNQALVGNGYPALVLQTANYEQNRKDVKNIIDRLKETGWQIGSSTYAYIPVTSAALTTVQEDWKKWQQQLEPLTGPVVSLQFPNGGLLSFSDERSIFYQQQGIKIFGGIGAASYISRQGNLVYVDKVQISGYSLENPGRYRLDRLFDANKVIDRDARKTN